MRRNLRNLVLAVLLGTLAATITYFCTCHSLIFVYNKI